MCWKAVSINLKNFAFLVSGGLWAPPVMFLPEKHYLIIFSPCIFMWVTLELNASKNQKIHWPGLEMLHLFRVELDRLEALQDLGQSDFKLIGVHTTSLLM